MSDGSPRLVLFLAALAVVGIIIAGAWVLMAGPHTSPAACFRSIDDCTKTCTDQGWKTEQGGSCATACAGWEESKCPSAAAAGADPAGYAECTGGCVHTNVVYTSADGTQNPADDACLEKCREKYLKN